MKRATKKSSGIYTFLKDANVLSGSNEALAQAKRDYWRNYRLAWRKSQRKRTKQYTVAFTAKEAERIAMIAKAHTRSVTKYLKEAAFAYADKRYLVPNEAEVGVIRQLLTMSYATLNTLLMDGKVNPENGRLLLFRMAELEHEILSRLNNPSELKTDSL